MEGVLIVLALIFGPPILKAMFSSDEPSVGNRVHPVANSRFLECRIEMGSLDMEGEQIAIVKFMVRGPIPTGTGLGLVVHLKARRGLVRCVLPAFQEAETLFFQLNADQVIHNQDGGLYWPDWAVVGAVPLVTLQGPVGGAQDCRVSMSFVGCEFEGDSWRLPEFRQGRVVNGRNPIRQEESPFATLALAETGYLEMDSKREGWIALTVRIAFGMAAADGVVDKNEADLIKAWIRKSLEDLSDSSRAKKKINEVITSLAATKFAVDTKSEAAVLASAPEFVKLSAIELVTEVLASDGEASDSELRLRDELIVDLELDAEECRALLDKKIAFGDLSLSRESGALAALGISEGLPRDELRRKLNAEFRKWNGRVTHHDPEVRARAEEMLELIASARSESLAASRA